MADLKNRKKVYILCGKDEYATIWEHLHEIIDVKRQELIIPYGFMEYEKIDATIKKSLDELEIKPEIEKEVLDSYYAHWFERKFTHFITFAKMASEIIITQNFECSELDSQEKDKEIKHCNTLKNITIRFLNMKEFTHQKTI